MPDINLLLNLVTKFAWLGNWIFLVLAFIESAPIIGIFIPGSTMIYIGGFLAAQGYFNPWDIVIFAIIGAILGDFFSYFTGRWGGEWINRKKIINQTIVKHGEDFFDKYGDKSIFIGRFFGPIRAIIPFIAGLGRMKPRPFIFWNVLSAIGWAFLNVFLGYFSGTLIVSIFKKWSGRLTIILILVSVAFVIYLILKKRGQSIKGYFKLKSQKFADLVNSYKWFKRLSVSYPFIPVFFKETKHAPEKLFGGFLVSILVIVLYLLIIILDVF